MRSGLVPWLGTCSTHRICRWSGSMRTRTSTCTAPRSQATSTACPCPFCSSSCVPPDSMMTSKRSLPTVSDFWRLCPSCLEFDARSDGFYVDKNGDNRLRMQQTKRKTLNTCWKLNKKWNNNNNINNSSQQQQQPNRSETRNSNKIPPAVQILLDIEKQI
ncbi:uncharacterized protein [Drosophila kikkawai]|uniref:Uncharacterized protein isoform X1 n=1 Tax=Drosophila kikkawai TaxID=30033 RepID=A0A6P4JN11_DROKI|nr:uncharacterized protein LOC108085070 isoform X1 [Drosophila kikkawai]